MNNGDNNWDRSNHFHCIDGSGENYVLCNLLTHCPSICDCPVGQCDAEVA